MLVSGEKKKKKKKKKKNTKKKKKKKKKKKDNKNKKKNNTNSKRVTVVALTDCRRAPSASRVACESSGDASAETFRRWFRKCPGWPAKGTKLPNKKGPNYQTKRNQPPKQKGTTPPNP